MSTFDDDVRRMQEADTSLQTNLTYLKNQAGADAADVLFFDMKDAGIGNLHEVVTTLMACVDALSARVALLENQ